MKLLNNDKTRRRIALVVMFFYMLVWSVNIFHHHHVNVLAVIGFNEQQNQGSFSHTYSFDQNLTCTVLSNYISISSIRVTSSIELLPDVEKDIFRIEFDEIDFPFSPFLNQQDLRAPPIA